MLYLKKENNRQISDVRRAFEDYISILGENTKKAMMFDLTILAEVHFDEPTLSITKLYEGLKMLYGGDTAEIIMEEVVVRMEKIAEERKQRE